MHQRHIFGRDLYSMETGASRMLASVRCDRAHLGIFGRRFADLISHLLQVRIDRIVLFFAFWNSPARAVRGATAALWPNTVARKSRRPATAR